MKCVLMNKNTEVLTLEYNTVLKGFDKIHEIRNIKFAPIILYRMFINKKDDKELLEQISDWFKGRGIPSWRDDLDLLLSKLNVSTPTELLDKAINIG